MQTGIIFKVNRHTTTAEVAKQSVIKSLLLYRQANNGVILQKKGMVNDLRKKHLVLTALLCLSAMAFAGCGQKDNADNAASSTPGPGASDDNVVNDIEDGVDDAVNDTKDVIDDAVDDAGDMVNDATGGNDDNPSDTGMENKD